LNPDRLLRQATIMADALDITRERLLSYVFAHACLSASWSLEDSQDPSLALGVAKIVEECINAPSISHAVTVRNSSGP
ncbi:hypothetical protein CNY89_29370, partial [Amaricoccus sp. HAR-UPW-R2A-40]